LDVNPEVPTPGRVEQTGQAVKEQASAVAGQSWQAVGEVAGEAAAEQVKTVAGEARQQAGQCDT
jgi:hypothetical protein